MYRSVSERVRYIFQRINQNKQPLFLYGKKVTTWYNTLIREALTSRKNFEIALSRKFIWRKTLLFNLIREIYIKIKLL